MESVQVHAEVCNDELATLRAFSEEKLAVEKKVLRKIDLFILPIVALIYQELYRRVYLHSRTGGADGVAGIGQE